MTTERQPITLLRFTVPGTPLAKGSLRAVRPYVIVDNNPKVPGWMAEIKKAALDAKHKARLPTLEGPLSVVATFDFMRPAGHYGTGRNRALLRPSAPTHMATRPDLDKLVRAVLDALTGQVWRDDNQVVELQATKRYGEPEQLEVEIRWHYT